MEGSKEDVGKNKIFYESKEVKKTEEEEKKLEEDEKKAKLMPPWWIELPYICLLMKKKNGAVYMVDVGLGREEKYAIIGFEVILIFFKF